MHRTPSPSYASGGYTTRDKLIVLSLAAEFGTESWSKIADFLARHGQPAIQKAKAYTQNECRDIYDAALREFSGTLNPAPRRDALSDALYKLKGQRLDEIQHSLNRISAGIQKADSTERESSPVTPVPATTITPAVAIHEKTSSGSEQKHAEIQPAIVSAPLPARPEGSLDEGYRASSASVEQSKSGMPLEHHTADAVKELASPAEPSEQPHNLTSSVATPMAVHQFETAAISAHSGSSSGNSSGNSSPAPGGEDDKGPYIDAAEYSQTRETEPTTAVADDRAVTSVADEQQLKNWKKNINMVWRDISGHRFGSMFLSPIKSGDAPHYYEVIRKPLDLKAIKNRIRDEDITTTIEFYRDIMHMLMNALMYNAEDTDVYHMAMEILSDAQACIEQLQQTEAAVNKPKDSPGPALPDTASTASVVKADDESKAEEPEADDSDASLPAKRRRRIASERASKHLRE